MSTRSTSASSPVFSSRVRPRVAAIEPRLQTAAGRHISSVERCHRNPRPCCARRPGPGSRLDRRGLRCCLDIAQVRITITAVSDLVTQRGDRVAYVCDAIPAVCRCVSSVGSSVTADCQPVATIGDDVTVDGHVVALISKALALLGGRVPPHVHRRQSVLRVGADRVVVDYH